jgi:predicted TPR repeat methyltransferase
MTDGFLDKVYELENVTTQELYTQWAASYDAEVTSAGYASPGRSAAALLQCIDDPTAPLLDMGCGTGLSGLAFATAGFTTIDGADLTQAMLDLAAKRGLYRELFLTDVSKPVPHAPGTYQNIAGIGLFSPKHAPASTITEVMTYLEPGGCFVFTLNDHALADPSYEGTVMNWVDSGAAEVLFREHGEHLPEQNLNATIYVLRRR